jgi:hypothetical protein
MVINSPGAGDRGRTSTGHAGTARADSLVEALGRLARDLGRHEDPETLLDAVVRGAVALVPGAEDGVVSLPTASPRAAPEAASVLLLPLPAGGGDLGVLTMYAHASNAFTEESDLIGRLYAGYAAMAIAALRERVQLNEAVRSRDLIGQAKGILMERYTISDERAFLTLRRISQDTNRKLHDIADELVRTRTLAGCQGVPPAGPPA